MSLFARIAEGIALALILHHLMTQIILHLRQAD